MVLLASEVKLPMSFNFNSSPFHLQSAGVLAENRDLCAHVNDLFVQGAGGAGIPRVPGKEMQQMCCRNFMQKMKVLALVGFSSAAEGKWDKMNKWKLFASLFFLPNCPRKRQNKQDR